jgi:hypothetical protein
MVSFFALGLHAQSWDVVRALRPGDAVRVEDKNRTQHQGTVTAVTEDGIALRVRKAEMSVARASVRRVAIKSGSRRVRNLAIGAAIGLAVGITADQSLGTYLRNEGHNENRALFYVAPIGLFGGLGAAIAPYRTIYRAK